MADVFISYAREDAEAARRFAEALAVVVLWSASSVVSRWVRAEATQAESDASCDTWVLTTGVRARAPRATRKRR
jgi:hypothetical protein